MVNGALIQKSKRIMEIPKIRQVQNGNLIKVNKLLFRLHLHYNRTVHVHLQNPVVSFELCVINDCNLFFSTS